MKLSGPQRPLSRHTCQRSPERSAVSPKNAPRAHADEFHLHCHDARPETLSLIGIAAAAPPAHGRM